VEVERGTFYTAAYILKLTHQGQHKTDRGRTLISVIVLFDLEFASS